VILSHGFWTRLFNADPNVIGKSITLNGGQHTVAGVLRPEIGILLSQVLEKQERWKEAIAAYRQALTNPLYATPDLARFHLGRALAHEGDYQGAMEAYEDALVVNPPNVPPALLNLELGRVYYKLGFERRSRETLTKVMTLDKGGEHAASAKELLTRLKP
jgi:tetratricopeptide (TPR) repeat protein